MNTLVRCLTTAALAASIDAMAAEPANPLNLLSFLADNCYTGTNADSSIDKHCFEWILGGRALRDTHTVKAPGRPDYVGETTYYWDSAAKRIEYLYVENAGGIMRGTVEPGDGAIVFPETRYVNGGQAMTLRVRWTLADSGYEAWSETQDKGEWKTMFRVKMQKSPAKSR